MKKKQALKVILLFCLITILVIGLSVVSNRIWGGKSEQLPDRKLVIDEGMTVGQFGKANQLPNPVLKEIFGLKGRSELGNTLSEYGTMDQIAAMVIKKRALAAERTSKNWIKIPVKFALWIVFLLALFMVLRKREMTPGTRKWLLLASLVIFGVVMGSDPSPMGTVKDAVRLFGTAHVVFVPRMIAMGIFLVMVFLVNKYICAWGCQVGTLQDLVFHLNRTDRHKAVIGRSIKLPFFLTNGIRILFFLVFSVIVFWLSVDIIDPIDPFKIYKPSHIGILGALFIGVMLIASLFVYRPWCHLFCPFGLAGWVVEKISLVKVSVNYDTCIACEKCAEACPSTVMGAVLKQNKRTVPDCFSCYTCREVCPTDSINFSSRKRSVPPPGFFKK